jgi:four helix bundle protein
MSHFGPPIAATTSNDPLFRMRVYQIAKDLLHSAWFDAKTLTNDQATQQIAGQLYAAIGSICANIGEGYSRSSGIDRARFFEYALGSARESMTWYEAGRPLLGEVVVTRLNDLEEVRRLLLAIIPRERARRGRLTKQ